jgi:parallel beta-helix repeat protein
MKSERRGEFVKRKGKQKALIFVILFATLAFVSIGIGCASAAIYVPDDYAKIQWAIGNATAGETIIVNASGSPYYENVVVNKQLTLTGESRETTIIDGGGSGVVVYVNADSVNISGFNITNGGTHGIHLYNSDNDVISDCIITSNAVLGIEFKPSSSYNTITGCDVCHNGASGIGLGDWDNQKYNEIVNCNVYSNNDFGIVGYITTDGTVVRDCNIYSNGAYGILVGWSSWTIANNTISNNLYLGIGLDTAVNTVITDCVIDSNTNIGVRFWGVPSRYNTVKNCTISNNNIGAQLGDTTEHDNELINCTLSNNDIGIDFGKSTKNRVINCTITGSSQYGILLKSTTSSNTLIGNTVTSNNDYGIYMESSSNNLLYNNYFNNPNNAWDNGNNVWNVTITAGTNIIGGSWLGGNYWSDYAGEDLNGDGLGDTLLPYNSYVNIANGGDWLPLVEALADTTPPASITNLINISFESTYINWTWTNPPDPDFSKVMVYLNGTFKTNVSTPASYYNATGLNPETSYEIGTRTVDTNGNINASWVNHTAMTAAAISCIIPTDDLYINSDTTLCPGTYDIGDAGAYGVIIINADNVVLDCNGAMLNGTGGGIYGGVGIYNPGFDNVTIKNCVVKNYFLGINLSSSTKNTIIKINASSNEACGICLDNSSDNTITNINANSNGGDGIHLINSDNNMLTNINASNNWYGAFGAWGYEGYGIALYHSSNNTLSYNNATNNDVGILLDSSSNNTLSYNNANSNNFAGICLASSSNNTLSYNNASNNNDAGILLYSSSNNTLSYNNASKNMVGILLEDYSSNNTLSYNNATNNNYVGIMLEDYSSNNTLSYNNANSNNDAGIYLCSSSNNTLTNNNASNNNFAGILLYSSSNNEIMNNIASNSVELGIGLEIGSNNNLIYNNYFDNMNNAYDGGYNIWNITKTAGTNIIGGPHLGGNYWSDYAGEDTDSDGLGDTLLPYNSSGNIQNGGDCLPLVVKPALSIFDTGKGTYPSIMGTHEGKIIPSRNISVSRLYTYPCAGTGGHSEYMKIWNGTLEPLMEIETMPWEGYKGDWHTLSFPDSFTLIAGETYNYTIRTGSYPQVHHTDNLEVAGGTGTITCDKFVDANGKEYNDWIPAIRLE